MVKVFFKRKKKDEKGRKGKNQEHAAREQVMNDPNVPESVRGTLKEQENALKKQE